MMALTMSEGTCELPKREDILVDAANESIAKNESKNKLLASVT